MDRLIVHARYQTKESETKPLFDRIKKSLDEGMSGPFLGWEAYITENAAEFALIALEMKDIAKTRDNEKLNKKYLKKMAEIVPGAPQYLSAVTHFDVEGLMEIDVTVRPVMYQQITQFLRLRFTEQEVQNAQHRCTELVHKVFVGSLGAAEIDKPSVSRALQSTELRNLLTSHNMVDQAVLLEEAEKKIGRGDPADGVKNCRSAIERVTGELRRRLGLRESKGFKNDLDALIAKGKISRYVADSVREFYCRLVSEDTHDRFVVGTDEGKLILAMTEHLLHYLLRKAS